MKKQILVFGFILVGFFLTSCSDIMFREIKCRDYTINGENYWFPTNKGDSVVFVNSSKIEKKFFVTIKYISHRTKYISDTGCGCFDESAMLLIGSKDSIWMHNELRYVEKQTGKYYEDLGLSINGKFTGLNETDKTKLNSYSIDSLSFSDVEKFDLISTDILKIKTIYRAKNIGIIRFELVNGEIWTNKYLNKSGQLTKDSFDYSENTCE